MIGHMHLSVLDQFRKAYLASYKEPNKKHLTEQEFRMKWNLLDSIEKQKYTKEADIEWARNSLAFMQLKQF